MRVSKTLNNVLMIGSNVSFLQQNNHNPKKMLTFAAVKCVNKVNERFCQTRLFI